MSRRRWRLRARVKGVMMRHKCGIINNAAPARNRKYNWNHETRPSRSLFSCTSTARCSRSRVREREAIRIFDRQSCTQTHLDLRSSAASDAELRSDVLVREGSEGDIRARSRSRARIGARERNDRKTSLRMISGDARRDDTVCGVGDGVDATVCKISPI
jgi:hypothetical protein